MIAITEQLLWEVAAQFDFPAAVTRIVRHGTGHINDTFAVWLEEGTNAPRRFILQRINSNVFTNPRAVQENISGITRYLREQILQVGGDPLRETLNMLPARDGNCYTVDSSGEYWRVYAFIEDTTSNDQVENEGDLYRSARAFGRFQQLLAGYPAAGLHDTIPNFHNTPERMRQLRAAVERDACGRVKEVAAELEFALAREGEAGSLLALLDEGKLPLRVTHNDTKLGNILLDSSTGEGICVIDLDTTMPGLSAYDFGDAIRSGAGSGAEDEQDLDKVHFLPHLFEVYTKGYLEVAGGALTDWEKQSLPLGAKLMTLECGIRFLADHLNGDVYFRIHREGQNLDRARTQFKLVAEMEQAWDQMGEIVKRYS